MNVLMEIQAWKYPSALRYVTVFFMETGFNLLLIFWISVITPPNLKGFFLSLF